MAYTTIDDPSVYFQTDLHTGDGSGSTETFDGNSDLQPDWLWYKSRSVAGDHGWVDTSRSKPSSNSSFFILRSNSTGGDVTVNSGSDFTAMNSDGYTYGSVHYLDLATNNSQNTVWGWKCNGGTTSSNSDGSLASTVQANTTAGFSIVTWTADGGGAKTIGHGLSAVPKWIITKNRTDNSTNWQIYHASNTSAPETEVIYFTTGATQDYDGFMADTAPTSSVFTVGGDGSMNGTSGKNIIAYCFRDIQGYSKFGSYTGNGNADGPFAYTGFKPAWLMIKRSDSAEGWHILDNKRDFNENNTRLQAESTNTDDTSENGLDMLSNGFKIRTSWAGHNASSGTYIYMAFAHHPFVSSKGVPVTAV